MKKHGRVVRWDSDKGYGFIRSPQTDADVFFHVRDWRQPAPPSVGQQVEYEEIHVGGKGPRAMDVRTGADARVTSTRSETQPSRQLARQTAPSTPGRSPRPMRGPKPDRHPATKLPAYAAMLLWAVLLVTGWARNRLEWTVLAAALVLNLVTFFVYWQDKHAARQGNWRTRESTLHLFGLLGGWPGAWFAHQILRHKSRKEEFRRVYWLTVVVHLAALGVWVSGTLPKLLGLLA